MVFLNPEEILSQISLKDDMIAADFGCGSGGFTIPLAKKLNNGFVYALDIQEPPLEALKGKAEAERITNLKFIICDIEHPETIKIPEMSLDLILVVNVLFQAQDKQSVISHARKLLKGNGYLLIVDWEPGAGQGPESGRVPLDQIKELAEQNGFQVEKEFEAGMYHYGIILKKP